MKPGNFLCCFRLNAGEPPQFVKALAARKNELQDVVVGQQHLVCQSGREAGWRTSAVAAFGGCATCHDAETRAFLAQLREIIATGLRV